MLANDMLGPRAPGGAGPCAPILSQAARASSAATNAARAASAAPGLLRDGGGRRRLAERPGDGAGDVTVGVEGLGAAQFREAAIGIVGCTAGNVAERWSPALADALL
jgi:hypothetical protein